MNNFLYNLYIYFGPESLIDDLYDESLLTVLTISLLGIAFASNLIFYYLINSIRFGQLRHWFITMIVTGSLALAIVFFTCLKMADLQVVRNIRNPKLGHLFDQGPSVFLMFGLEMALFSAIAFLLFSIALKWGSTNSRATPF